MLKIFIPILYPGTRQINLVSMTHSILMLMLPCKPVFYLLYLFTGEHLIVLMLQHAIVYYQRGPIVILLQSEISFLSLVSNF